MALSFSESHATSLLNPQLSPGERVLYKARGVEKPWYSRLFSRLGSLFWRNYLLAATDQRLLFVQHGGLLSGYATKKVDSLAWGEIDGTKLGWGIFNKNLTVRAQARGFQRTVVLGRFWMKGNFPAGAGVVQTWTQQKSALPGARNFASSPVRAREDANAPSSSQRLIKEKIMKLSLLLITVPFAAVLVIGCSKPSPEEEKKREDEIAQALASAMAQPASSAPVTSATVQAAPSGGGIHATCNNAQDGKCTESLGAEGIDADGSCKRLGGTYTKGATPCARDNLLGTCTRSDASSSLNDVDYYYKQSGVTADSMKSLCDVVSGTWAAAPASSAKPAAHGKKR